MIATKPLILIFVVLCNFSWAQFACSDSLIYLSEGGFVTIPFIKVYNPKLPISASNPSNTSIPNLSGGLSLMPNNNGGFVSPTFYSQQNFGSCYWNGNVWINTGQPMSSSGFGGCAGVIYSIITPAPTIIVSKYFGTGLAIPILTLTGLAVGDVVTDCDCNFYVINNSVLKKFDPNGVLLASYTLTGGVTSGTGLAIIGKSVYVFYGSGSVAVGNIVGSTITFTTLSGNLGFQVGDAASCPASSLNNIQVSVNTASIGCSPTNASLAVTSTSSPLSYHWSGPGLTIPSNSSTVMVNAPGVYTCIVTEGNCMYDLATVVTTVINTASMVSPVITPSNNLCLRNNQHLFSSLSSTLYSNQWAGPSVIGGGNTATVSINSAGIYSLLVTNISNGCTGSATASVLVVPDVSVSLSTNTLCVFSQQSPNAITLSSSGAFNYTLLASQGFSFNTNPSQPVSLFLTPPYPIGGAIGSATLYGSNGACTGSATTGFYVLPVTTISTVSEASLICLGKSTKITASGALSYTWFPTEGLTTYNDSTVFAHISKESIYTVIGTDQFGCKTPEEKVSLGLFPPHKGHLSNAISSYCAPFLGEFNFVPDPLANNPVKTEWAINEGAYSSKPLSYYFNSSGIYTITIKLSDSLNACTNTLNYFVQAFRKPEVDFYFFPQIPNDLSEEVIFTAQVNEQKISHFDWHFVNNNGFKSNKPQFSYGFDKEGLYPVALVVRNTEGCTDTVIKVVEVKGEFGFYIPNTFTPNGDNRNDVFAPVIQSAKLYQLRIFNRWGDLIFKTNSFTEGWDGSFKGQNCQDGSYVWEIELTTLSGQAKHLNGVVNLYR